MGVLKKYTTEEIEIAIHKKKILSDLSSKAFRRKVFEELVEVEDFSFMANIPGIEHSIIKAKMRKLGKKKDILTIRQPGVQGLGAEYKLMDFNNNGKDNLKLVQFLVCRIGMTNIEALKIMFNIGVFTKSNIRSKLNTRPSWASYKSCQDYILRTLNPATSKHDFDLLEEFHDLEHKELVPDSMM